MLFTSLVMHSIKDYCQETQLNLTSGSAHPVGYSENPDKSAVCKDQLFNIINSSSHRYCVFLSPPIRCRVFHPLYTMASEQVDHKTRVEESRNLPAPLKKLLEWDVKVTKKFVSFLLNFVALRSLKTHCRFLEVRLSFFIVPLSLS